MALMTDALPAYNTNGAAAASSKQYNTDELHYTATEVTHQQNQHQQNRQQLLTHYGGN